MKTLILLILATLVTLVLAQSPPSSDPEATVPGWSPMTEQRLQSLVRQLDEQARAQGPQLNFSIRGRDMLMVMDSRADRMRVLTPVVSLSDLNGEQLMRSLQANFDSALDARYAVANGMVWSIFIHPLSPLRDDQFISALAQTYTAAETFGTTYTSGALVFGGGDSADEQRKLLEELERKLNPTI